MKIIIKPNATHAPAYSSDYIALVPTENLLLELENSRDDLLSLIETLNEELGDYAYAPGKWTMKELVRHIIDAERIFVYRAFRFSRKDLAPLPGFDEDAYVAITKGMQWSWKQIADDFRAVRASSFTLYASLTDDMLDHVGTANGHPYSPRALGYMTVGHHLHHTHVLRAKYLSK